jgi:hypothetical protein
MNRILIALISLTLLCTACSHNKPTRVFQRLPFNALYKAKDTLAFTYEGADGQINYVLNDGNQDHDVVDHITVDYPVFKSRTGLNDTIKQLVLGTLKDYGGDDKDTTRSLTERVKRIIKSNTSQPDTTDTEETQQTYYELHIRVISQSSNILVLETGEVDSGGAHPNSHVTYLTWDTKKDEEIVLDDVLIKNYESTLAAIADKIIREEKLNEDLSEGDTFALNSNYYFAPDGIHFYYNSYEIKAYVFGPTDLLIPYSKIKKLIRPGSVLSQYIK